MSFKISTILNKVTAILTAIETATGITITPKTLSVVNDTVEAGYYEATTLSAVDADLAADNIKSGVTIFGIVGAADIQDIDDATATVGDVLDTLTFYAGTGGIKTGTLALTGDAVVGDVMDGKFFYSDDAKTQLEGTLATVALAPASGAYPAGYHVGDVGGLVAVEVDLVEAKIKAGTTIFGVLGTYETPVTGDAAVGDVLTGKTFYANDATSQLVGIAAAGANVNGVDGELVITITDGLYTGSKTATAADADLLAANIKDGVTIFGVEGTYDESVAPITAATVKTGLEGFVNGAKVIGSGTQTLSVLNDTVAAGYYEATTLSAVDADLATANIKSGATIFGIAGQAEVVDTTDAVDPAVSGDMRTGAVAFVNGAKVTGDGTKTLSADNDTVAAGYYAATTLAAVDADLAVGNIKAGETVFGVLGTYETVITGDAAVGNVMDGKFFYADDSTTKLEGTLPTVALDPALNEYPTGYHAGDTSLTAVDAQLAAANIKDGIVIFGVEGTYDESATPIVAAAVQNGLEGFVNGAKVTGTATAGGDVVGANGDLEILITAGIYVGTEHTTASDTNLVASKIQDGVTIFGVEGTYDESATPITAATVQTGLEGFVNGAKVTGAGTKTLSVADDHVHAGYYEETTLAAVDTDLVTGNIKSGATIFGVAGKAEVVDTTEAGTPAEAAHMKTGDIAYVNGAQVVGSGTQTLTDANDTVAEGYYAATTLSAVDTDLAEANIKAGQTIFGVLGTYETPLTGDAVVGEVLDGKFFYADDATTKLEGTMPTVALDPASGAYPAGYHVGNGGGLVAVEADLVEGKIKAGTTIFGVLGTYETVLTGDAVVGDVKDGKFFYSDDGTVQLEGTMPTVALDPGLNQYPAGYHAGDTSLTAVEASLITVNIKTGITIFGVNGSANVVDTTEESNAATAADIATGKFAWVNGVRIEGTHV